AENWSTAAELGTMPEILSPGEKNEAQDCKASIAAVRKELEQKQHSFTQAFEAILGKSATPKDKADVERITQAVDQAMNQLHSRMLSELPSIQASVRLGKVSRQDIAAAEKVLEDLMRRATAMEALQGDRQRAARWQLYSRVALWHREHHPETDLTHCPVCGTDLGEAPADALLDLSVREALEQCRNVEADVAKTLAEWVRDEASVLVDALPKSIAVFVDESLPEELEVLYRQGFVEELLGQAVFDGHLKPLRKNGKALWEQLRQKLQLLPKPPTESVESPAVLNDGKLGARLTNVKRALALARHRGISMSVLETRLKRYVGRSVAEASEGAMPQEPPLPNEAPLREQLQMIRQAANNALPIVSLISQLTELDSVRSQWEAQEKRLQLISRTMHAITAFLGFPPLVYARVTGLLNTLHRGIDEWLDKLYRAHYIGGPRYSGFDPLQDKGLGLRAGMDVLRVPAHHVLNASQLRAGVWAFLFSLWEHVIRHAGGLDCLLLDDPQTYFDPQNCQKLAAAIPEMPIRGMRPIVATNDQAFMAAIHVALPRPSSGQPSWTSLSLNPISRSRCKADVSSAIDEVRDCRDEWNKDENNVQKAR